MQRLISRLRRRTSDERGVTAVVVALLMVPLIGFAAIAVDIGKVYAERARLQIAADAAALAVAQDCARGNCGDMQATASAMVAANETGSTAAPPVLASAPLRVTVTGDKPTQHWFAPVLGVDATEVTASATVAWGAPGAGTAVLPVTFSYCSFLHQTGGLSTTSPSTVLFTKTANDPCPAPAGGNAVPGGFAYVNTDPGTCQATSAIAQLLASDSGNTPPSSCGNADFDAWLGQTVLLPLFDQAGSTGSHAWYRVYGYAAFTLTGYFLGGQYSSSPQPCTGNDRCIAGYFTRFVDQSDRFTYTDTGPDLGADILRLIR